jgi:hypothetical protein
MRLVDSMTSEDAVKTVGNVPESAKFLGAFKLNGSGTLQGSVVQVAAGADLYDLKFPANPVKLPATVFLFASAQTNPGALGLTPTTAKQVEVACDSSGNCGAIDSNGGHDSATGGQGAGTSGNISGPVTTPNPECYASAAGKRNDTYKQCLADNPRPEDSTKAVACCTSATVEYVKDLNQCDGKPDDTDPCERLKKGIADKTKALNETCNTPIPPNLQDSCKSLRNSLDAYKQALEIECDEPANSPPP